MVNEDYSVSSSFIPYLLFLKTIHDLTCFLPFVLFISMMMNVWVSQRQFYDREGVIYFKLVYLLSVQKSFDQIRCRKGEKEERNWKRSCYRVDLWDAFLLLLFFKVFYVEVLFIKFSLVI